MNERELFDAIGEVDEAYIEDASPEKKPKRLKISAVTCLAACLALVIAAFPVLFILTRKEPQEPSSVIDVVVWGTENAPDEPQMYNSLLLDKSIVDGMNNYQYDADQAVNIVYAMAANCSPENTAVLDDVKKNGMSNIYLAKGGYGGLLVLFVNAQELNSLDPAVYGDLVFYNITKEEYEKEKER